MRITMQREIKGSILDIGGGGEGIISRIYPDHILNTTYGIYKEDAEHNSEYFKGFLKGYNLKMLIEKSENGHFYQKWEKCS